MKNVYQILSDRGGHYHNLVKYNDESYVFLPAEDWMPMQILYGEDDAISIDTEGGPFITAGWHNDEISIECIKMIGNRILFELKEIKH